MDSKVVEGVNPPTNFQYFLSLREHPQHTRTTRDQLSGTVLKIVVLQRNRTEPRNALRRHLDLHPTFHQGLSALDRRSPLVSSRKFHPLAFCKPPELSSVAPTTRPRGAQPLANYQSSLKLLNITTSVTYSAIPSRLA